MDISKKLDSLVTNCIAYKPIVTLLCKVPLLLCWSLWNLRQFDKTTQGSQNIKYYQNESNGSPVTRWHHIWLKYLQNCNEKEYWAEYVFNFSLKLLLQTFFTPTNISLVKVARDIGRNGVKCPLLLSDSYQNRNGWIKFSKTPQYQI